MIVKELTVRPKIFRKIIWGSPLARLKQDVFTLTTFTENE